MEKKLEEYKIDEEIYALADEGLNVDNIHRTTGIPKATVMYHLKKRVKLVPEKQVIRVAEFNELVAGLKGRIEDANNFNLPKDYKNALMDIWKIAYQIDPLISLIK